MEHLSKQGPGFIVLFDMSGWKISFSLQVAKLKVLVGTLQNHYPERLRAALIIHTPGFFQATWRMMKPWLDPHTVEKVRFVCIAQALQALVLHYCLCCDVPTLRPDDSIAGPFHQWKRRFGHQSSHAIPRSRSATTVLRWMR
eukprot:scaffold297510_cov43-Tisochrysis_lutea.AAC.2